jgi:hypothetical protein
MVDMAKIKETATFMAGHMPQISHTGAVAKFVERRVWGLECSL